jgi:hypothetical protein
LPISFARSRHQGTRPVGRYFDAARNLFKGSDFSELTYELPRRDSVLVVRTYAAFGGPSKLVYYLGGCGPDIRAVVRGYLVSDNDTTVGGPPSLRNRFGPTRICAFPQL